MNPCLSDRIHLERYNSKDSIPLLKFPHTSTFFYRKAMISKIKSLLFTPTHKLDNSLQVFYSSIHNLDILLSQNFFNLSNSFNQNYLSITSLILSLKFIGIYDNKIYRLIRDILIQNKISDYPSFELQVIKCLNYKLTHLTPYDHICNFLSNPFHKDIKDLSLNILKWFVESNKFIAYSSLVISLAIIQYAQSLMNISLYLPSMKGIKKNNEQTESLIEYLEKEFDYSNYNQEDEDWNKSKKIECFSHRESVNPSLKMNLCLSDRKSVMSQYERKDSNSSRDSFIYKKKIVSRNNSPNHMKFNIRTSLNMKEFNPKNIENRKIDLSKITTISIENFGKLCTKCFRTEFQ